MTTNNALPSEQIQEGNKLIAEFSNYLDNGPAAKYCYDENIMLYHSSWDWLMPVVEKISTIPLIDAEFTDDVSYPLTFNYPTGEGMRLVRFRGQAVFEGATLIEATYLAVVDFIKWHNEQK